MYVMPLHSEYVFKSVCTVKYFVCFEVSLFFVNTVQVCINAKYFCQQVYYINCAATFLNNEPSSFNIYSEKFLFYHNLTIILTVMIKSQLESLYEISISFLKRVTIRLISQMGTNNK